MQLSNGQVVSAGDIVKVGPFIKDGMPTEFSQAYIERWGDRCEVLFVNDDGFHLVSMQDGGGCQHQYIEYDSYLCVPNGTDWITILEVESHATT